MSEETSTPNPAGRRRNAPEESGGGGKMLPIILGLAVLGLGYALYKSKSGVGNEEAKYTNEIASLKVTNQELAMKLAKETNSALADKSKLEALLDRRTAEVAAYSNRLVQTRQQLEREEAALLAARNEISTKSTTLGAVETHRDELLRQAAAIPGLEREVTAAKREANLLQLDCAAWKEKHGRVDLERADLERKLQDPLFLRSQATLVEQSAVLRQRAAANQPIKMKNLVLDLQPDGSVRPAIATSAPMPTNSSPKN